MTSILNFGRSSKDRGYLLWDFDGTLARRDGMWSGALSDAIRRYCPDRRISAASIRPHLTAGFPWHTPEREHKHTRSSEAWWGTLRPTFERAITALGIEDPTVTTKIAEAVAEEYLDVRAWRVADGANSILNTLHAAGWRHVIVSNHVPELSNLLENLKLSEHFEHVFCSALLGVEKPNPAFLRRVLADLGSPHRSWLIGDSVHADIVAACDAQIPSILVGSKHPSATFSVDTLYDAAEVLLREQGCGLGH
jgi:putative hydrolase of the HAD superfamily